MIRLYRSERNLNIIKLIITNVCKRVTTELIINTRYKPGEGSYKT